MDLELLRAALRDLVMVVSALGLLWAGFGLLREAMAALEDEYDED